MSVNTLPDPIATFNLHWRDSLRASPLKQKSAVCVSTLCADGFPNSRFVDLKLADDRGLVFCTSLDSAKARDIARNAKAGITAWWDHIGIQARFQGTCEPISDEEATVHWRSRSRDAQLTTASFHQSMPLDDPARLATTLQSTRREYADREIERPVTWGGYRLVPVHVELLEFRDDRLHVRTCYTRVGGSWKLGHLQP